MTETENYEKIFHLIAKVICKKPDVISANNCFKSKGLHNPLCKNYGCCRIEEKTEQQLNYITYPINRNSFLKACPGSGKTEVVGMRAAFEINNWSSAESGIAVLTFTNNAADIIKDRIIQFTQLSGPFHPHYIGTIDSWLHGYLGNPFSHLLTGYEGVNKDKSLRLVDISSKASFLYSFRTKYGYGNRGKISANQYYFDPEHNKFEFLSSDRGLDSQRNKIQFEDWQLSDIKNTKKRFWKNGYVTFQDVEFLCYKILKKEYSVRKKVAARFPVIIVDECQDLSWVQMEILRLIKDCGTHLHFVGDLNQAIYAFKKVYPEKVEKFTKENNFRELNLTRNFRSLQPIVNLCTRLIGENKQIEGRLSTKKRPVCMLFLYKTENLAYLPMRFVNYIEQNSIDLKRSAILARGNSMVFRLRPGLHPRINRKGYLPALAIHLWGNSKWESIKEALDCIGKFISVTFYNRENHDSRNQYRPERFESNIEWRLLLARILDNCLSISELRNLSLTWSNWAKSFRKYFPIIWEECYENLYFHKIKMPSENWYRSPIKMGNKKVLSSLETISASRDVGIRITTIHQAKGETLDAVMLVSQLTKQGTDGGHWEQWLDDKDEHTRFAFVASSRPRELLIWAIPERDKNRSERLINLGFALE